MKVEDMKVGKYYVVKKYNNTRPLRWNCFGEMDKWMGCKVKIKNISGHFIRICEESGWIFSSDDFEYEKLFLEKELFII